MVNITVAISKETIGANTLVGALLVKLLSDGIEEFNKKMTDPDRSVTFIYDNTEYQNYFYHENKLSCRELIYHDIRSLQVGGWVVREVND